MGSPGPCPACEANLNHETAQTALHRLASIGAISIQHAADEERTVTADRLHIDPYWLTHSDDFLGTDAAGGWEPDLKSPELWLPVHSHIWDWHGRGVAALRVYCELTRG